MKQVCLTSRGRHSLDLRERPSGSQLGESRPSLGGGRSESLVTYCCIFVMEYCDAGMHALRQVSVEDYSNTPTCMCFSRPHSSTCSLERICHRLSQMPAQTHSWTCFIWTHMWPNCHLKRSMLAFKMALTLTREALRRHAVGCAAAGEVS